MHEVICQPLEVSFSFLRGKEVIEIWWLTARSLRMTTSTIFLKGICDEILLITYDLKAFIASYIAST